MKDISHTLGNCTLERRVPVADNQGLEYSKWEQTLAKRRRGVRRTEQAERDG